MIRYIVVHGESEAIGPFDTREAADAYIRSDWQGTAMRVIELYAPADDVEVTAL